MPTNYDSKFSTTTIVYISSKDRQRIPFIKYGRACVPNGEAANDLRGNGLTAPQSSMNVHTYTNTEVQLQNALRIKWCTKIYRKYNMSLYYGTYYAKYGFALVKSLYVQTKLVAVLKYTF